MKGIRFNCRRRILTVKNDGLRDLLPSSTRKHLSYVIKRMLSMNVLDKLYGTPGLNCAVITPVAHAIVATGIHNRRNSAVMNRPGLTKMRSLFPVPTMVQRSNVTMHVWPKYASLHVIHHVHLVLHLRNCYRRPSRRVSKILL